MIFSLKTKTSIRCSKCKCMIDIEGAEVNKNHRLAFIEDGVAFCQDCVSHLLYSLDNSSGESFVNP